MYGCSVHGKRLLSVFCGTFVCADASAKEVIPSTALFGIWKKHPSYERSRTTVKTAVRLPIAIIFSETEILRQGGGMPKRWAQPRSTVSLLEKPTLRRLQQKRMNIAAQLKEIPAIAADRTNIPWDITRSLGMVSRHIKKWQRRNRGFLSSVCSFALHNYCFFRP